MSADAPNIRDEWVDEPEPIHLWFGLTYSNYLVLPRSILQSMPQPWQARFCELLSDAQEAFGHLDWPTYDVCTRGDGGRYKRDPIPHYNRGRTRLSPQTKEHR